MRQKNKMNSIVESGKISERSVLGSKEKSLIITALLFSILMTGCAPKQEPVAVATEKPVQTLLLEQETVDMTIAYTGNVEVKDSRTFAFKSPGKIAEMMVEKGQQIKVGDPLAKLDTTDLNFAREAAAGKVAAANAQYQKAVNGPTKEDIRQLEINVNKAQDALAYTEDLYGKMEELYQAGAIPQNERDKVKLERDVRQNDLNQANTALQNALNGTRKEDVAMARADLSMAQTDLKYKDSQIQDSILRSDMEGYVAEIIQKEGSYVSAGYPVIALRGEAQVVKTGIARQDMDKVAVGTKVYILEDDREINATVTYISDLADPTTRTYEAEITPLSGELSIGSIVEINIVIGEDTGIWVPISAMMSDGKDYVFLVKGEEKTGYRSIRREVTILSTRGAYAKVAGVTSGDRLIVEGMRSVKDQEPIKIMGAAL